MSLRKKFYKLVVENEDGSITAAPNELLDLFKTEMGSIIGEDDYPKEVVKGKRDIDFWQTDSGQKYLFGDRIREQQRAELEKRIK